MAAPSYVTTPQPYSVVKGGVETFIQTYAKNMEIRGLSHVPGLRGGMAQVPGRTGASYRQGRVRDVNTFVFDMWVRDTDDNGANPSYLRFRNNIDALNTLFDTSTNMIEVREYIDSANPTRYRRAFCSVENAIAPEVYGDVLPMAWASTYKVELLIPSGTWEDDLSSTFTSPVGTGAVGTFTLTPFVGGSARIEDASIIVDGPLTNPALTDVESGQRLSLGVSIPAGQQWCVNAGTWDSYTGTAIENNITSGTQQGLATNSTGPLSPACFPISPSAKVSLSGTGADTTTKLRITARRKFY